MREQITAAQKILADEALKAGQLGTDHATAHIPQVVDASRDGNGSEADDDSEKGRRF
jgi:hypothetical protein